MKPKPFFSLNHFTVPRAMTCYLHRGCCLLGDSLWGKVSWGLNLKTAPAHRASTVTHASDCIPPDSVTTSSLILCMHPLDTVPSVPDPYSPCQGCFGTSGRSGCRPLFSLQRTCLPLASSNMTERDPSALFLPTSDPSHKGGFAIWAKCVSDPRRIP